MIRSVFAVWLALLCAVSTGHAQDLTGLARVLPDTSRIEDRWRGRTQISLGLSQGVPFRVFTLDGPPRLVIDFREVDWAGIRREALLPKAGRIAAVRFGAFQPGWSRLVADLAEPMLPEEVGMVLDPSSGRAQLDITLTVAEAEAFQTASGRPHDPSWQVETRAPDIIPDDGAFTVVIDPGHGGVDPGAERDGLSEKELMLRFAIGLRDRLVRNGLTVVLTREKDVFVALDQRVAIAHQVEADLFLSLHADSLSQGRARGATVYTLSVEASDVATAHLAARHNRSDLIAGVDLNGSDDEVASVLLDLARQETLPRALALAETIVETLGEAGGPMNKRPLREAGFSVLKSATIPSVLVEVGFLSSDRDLKNLKDPVWRAGITDGLARAVLRWRDMDAARAPLMRQ